MFPKVKNVNVKSLKIRSKLLDFWSDGAGETKRRERERKSQRDKESKRGRDGGRIIAWKAVL